MQIEMRVNLIALGLTQTPITVKIKVLGSQFIISALLMLELSMNEISAKFMIYSSIINSD